MSRPVTPLSAETADARGMQVAIVVSTYHASITGALTQGARDALTTAGASAEQISVFPVPGAFELPLVARRVAATGRFAAVVCLGCVIQGETPHFDYLASAVAHGITAASQATGVPISFGVLTTTSHDQAVARAGPGPDNKGHEAALAAVGVAQIVRQLGDE